MKQINTLLIFIKNPVAGKVKTRLAKDVGDQRALDIYLALQHFTRKSALAVPAKRILYYSDSIETTDLWPNDQFEKRVQKGPDLGIRMINAFEEAFQVGGPVVIIGSDCPGLEPPLLEMAFLQLKDNEFVIGPANDGGYYLLGMQSFQPSVFENMAWSTEDVLENTLARIEQLEASYYLLPTLSDVDYLEDWQNYGWPWIFNEKRED